MEYTKCVNCGKNFSGTMAKRKNRKFCSLICARAYRNAASRVLINKFCTCSNCGEVFQLARYNASYYSNDKKNYYCVSCKKKAAWNEKRKGEIKSSTSTEDRVNNQGYPTVFLEKENEFGRTGRIELHKIVAEKKLGRALKKGEQVHHKNFNKLDSQPENLIVMSNKEHGLCHASLESSIAPLLYYNVLKLNEIEQPRYFLDPDWILWYENEGNQLYKSYYTEVASLKRAP